MSLSIGIVGLPNVGKSTLFNALTKNNVLAANYPFATIEPNVGIVPVPDGRLAKLHELYPTSEIIPAVVTFVDIAGLVRGAAEGQGLGNQFLSHIRECQAICQVVRAFDDPNVTHVEGKVDPQADIDTIRTELALADMQTLEKRLPKLESDAKGDPKLRPELEAAHRTRQDLDAGRPIDATELPNDLNLLSAKPIIYVFNVDEAGLQDQARQQKLTELVSPAAAIFLCAKIEAELAELPEAEASELLRSLGQDSSGLGQLAQAGFKTLGLQTFLTAGPKEVRAWTIKKGATAPEAAGVIHTDFQKGFIKAEVVSYHDLTAAGSESAAKAAGKVRLEGRDYLMRDGDVVEFKFNV